MPEEPNKKLVVAIDVDGTITAGPEVYEPLMRALMKDGHKVYVLTGAITMKSPGAHVELRMQQLATFGIHKGTHYTDLHVFVDSDSWNIARMKCDFLRDNDVALFIDDSKPYLETSMVISPRTLRLWPHSVRAE